MILNDRKPVIILAAFAAAGLLIGFLAEPGNTPGFLVCSFKLITGLPCPGCGMTRAVIALAHGDLVAALKYHPFVVVVFPGMAGLMVYPLVMNHLSEAAINRLDRIFVGAVVILFSLMLFYNFYRWYIILTVGGYSYI